MHILLTDVLACPRCGPGFGLIVLADEMDERRVMEGRLGCANCREEYLVRAGVTDLRLIAGSESSAPAAAPAEDEDAAFRIAALLGIGHGMGTVMVMGGTPELVDRIDSLLPNAQAIGGGAAGARTAGAGWILHGPKLPYRDRSLRGVAILGGADGDALGETARVLAPGARLVLDPATPESADLVADHGLTVILRQDSVLVAAARAPG